MRLSLFYNDRLLDIVLDSAGPKGDHLKTTVYRATLLLVLVGVALLSGDCLADSEEKRITTSQSVSTHFTTIPHAFVENMGQWDDQVLFCS